MFQSVRLTLSRSRDRQANRASTGRDSRESMRYRYTARRVTTAVVALTEITTTRLSMLDRIKVNPEVCGGRPTIRGMRITVDFVLKLLGDGYTADDIARLYPELEKEDVYQAAKYGAWLASERTTATV